MHFADVLPDPIILPINNQNARTAHAIAQDPRLATAVTKLRVFELVWLFDSFCLRGYDLHLSPLHVSEQLSAHYNQRLSNDLAVMFASLGCGPDERKLPYSNLVLLPDICQPLAPYSQVSYNQPIIRTSERVRWSRPGRIWTKAEAKELLHKVGDEWTREFGHLEELFASADNRVPVLAMVSN